MSVALLALVHTATALGQPPPTITSGPVTIEALGEPGRWTGFSAASDGQAVATVSLTSGGRWHARNASVSGGVKGRTLTLRGINTSGTGGAPKLGPESWVKVSLAPEQRFAKVEFRLDLKELDQEAWEAAQPTACPLHFLCCSIAEPELYYFHGLLAPTPGMDPYPFSWRDMRGEWADGWSTAPAIGALTVPATGLWKPTEGTLAAYCFQHARSTDHSSRDIASVYHWPTEEQPNEWFGLVWPYQRGWNRLTYPEAPAVIESHFDLLLDDDTGPTGDLNRFIFDHIWREYAALLPQAPRMNDLGWMVERNEVDPAEPGSHVFATVRKSDGSFCSSFYRDETVVLGGSFRGTQLAYMRGDEAALERLRADVEGVLEHATWETVEGDECCHWRHPFEGGFDGWIGGDAADTTHNVQQFGFGGTLVAMYLNEPSDRLWRHITGLYNWAKHAVYTRGDICDIPCSMFTRQTDLLAMNFLLPLHHGLREDADPGKRALAEEAFALAETVVWRNANVTTSDPDPDDALDPTFLMPGNHARFWLGQVSWAELCDVFRSMVVMYVETGDERLKAYVRGALEKWWTGFEADGYHTAENMDVFGETAGKGARTGVHGPQDSFWEWAYPVGEATLRVTAGREAAIAFCKGTRALDITDYRFREPGHFAFRITGPSPEPIGLVFSSPFRDLSGLSVRVNGQPVEDARVAGRFGEHILLTAPAGATVEVGDVGDTPVTVAARPARRKTPHVRTGSMLPVDLGDRLDTALERSWSGPESWAGLAPGSATAYGVPYVIADPELQDGRMAAGPGLLDIGRKAEGLFLFATDAPKNGLSILVQTRPEVGLLDDQRVGTDQPKREWLTPDTRERLPVAGGWPLQDWEVWMYPLALPVGALVESVDVAEGVLLLALTLDTRTHKQARELVARAAEAAETRRVAEVDSARRRSVLLKARRRVRDQMDAKGAVRAALLPPHGPSALRIREALQELRIPAVALGPADIIDPGILTPTHYPILIYTGREHYLQTIAAPGDGEQALLHYLKTGGTLVVMGDCRPFAYADDLTAPDAEPNHTLFGRELGLDLLGPGEARGGAIGFETPPEGELVFSPEEQDVFRSLPDTVPFPTSGDRRYRPASGDSLPPGDTFTPLLTLQDAEGTRYGPAAALIRRSSQGFRNANILWVWGTLLSEAFTDADIVLHEALAAATELCGPASVEPPIGAARSDPPSATVALLPFLDPARSALAGELAGDLNIDLAEVRPDVLAEPTAFTAAHFPIGLHAPKAETYVDTWRLPGDGADAYTRYVEEGGFLIACGNATQFWYPGMWDGEEWRQPKPVEPTMSRALGLPIAQAFERPPNGLRLEPVKGQEVFPGLSGSIDVSGLSDQRWRGLYPTRGRGIEFTPLAYVTDSEGSRYNGCAAALIRRNGEGSRPGAILYIWGNLIEPGSDDPTVSDLARELLGSALEFAMDDVQVQPEE